MTATQGRVDDGSAVTAYDEEEVARRTTMANAAAFAEWNGVKINLLDRRDSTCSCMRRAPRCCRWRRRWWW